MSPIISIIIPAYNAEKYLNLCIDSIISQTFQDWELLIVDDGSSDSTYEIAKEYEKTDSRIHLFKHETNKGQSAARELAMSHASGEYSIHVDADDWIESGMLHEMYNLALQEHSDMVICDWIMKTKDGDHYEEQRPKSLESRDIFCQMLRPDLHASLCNKLIRTKCYRDVDFHFIPGMLMEDQYACLCILSKPIKVSYLNKAFYHYDRTQNVSSTVNLGIPPEKRLRPLELIAKRMDISKFQNEFDRAIFFISFEALQFPYKICPNYPALFKPHIQSIKRVQGVPLHAKLLVLLRINHIDIPIQRIKRYLKR